MCVFLKLSFPFLLESEASKLSFTHVKEGGGVGESWFQAKSENTHKVLH